MDVAWGELQAGHTFSDAEFEEMGWHDVRVHAVGFSPETFELLLDVDYILEWRGPRAGEDCYEFVVAPATLVFLGVSDLHFDLHSFTGEFSIDDLRRDDPQPTPNGATDHAWWLETNEGTVRFRAVGFRQHLRRVPQVLPGQSFTLEGRGGHSFAVPAGV